MTNIITVASGELKLSPIEVNQDYLTKWNNHNTDFVCLTRNGEVLNNNALYRVGGLGKPDLSAEYFMLLKYTEAFYDDNITKDRSKKPHLQSSWVILDKNGTEKVEFKDSIDYPYLVNGSCIYSYKGKYYNIETGYMYSDAGTSIHSNNYLIVGSQYSGSTTPCIKINKRTGEFEVIN